MKFKKLDNTTKIWKNFWDTKGGRKEKIVWVWWRREGMYESGNRKSKKRKERKKEKVR